MNKLKTLIYREEEIFNLKFNRGYNATIEFIRDESIEVITLGDPSPWKLVPLERKLFIKPIEAGVRTNMTVITNKRVYLFEIECGFTSNSDALDCVHVVRFFAPTS